MRILPALLLAGLVGATGALAQTKEPVDAGPYVPSPQSVVADMLRFAKVTNKDFVIDLGSGDGRIVRTAATVFGARGFGVEIKDELVRLSNDAAKNEGIADRVKFIKQDLFKTDLSNATVITMYLLPNTVIMLKDKFWDELKPGTRILSHDYPLAGWKEDDSRTFDLPEKVSISGVPTTIFWLYTVPAKVNGVWKAQLPAAIAKAPVALSLRQQFKEVAGNVRLDGRDVPLENIRLNGDRLTFRIPGHSGSFAGQVKGNAIEGTFDGTMRWSATLGS